MPVSCKIKELRGKEYRCERKIVAESNRKRVIIFMAALIFVAKEFSHADESEYPAFI
jgi:hypothetical protein